MPSNKGWQNEANLLHAVIKIIKIQYCTLTPRNM